MFSRFVNLVLKKYRLDKFCRSTDTAIITARFNVELISSIARYFLKIWSCDNIVFRTADKAACDPCTLRMPENKYPSLKPVNGLELLHPYPEPSQWFGATPFIPWTQSMVWSYSIHTLDPVNVLELLHPYPGPSQWFGAAPS